MKIIYQEQDEKPIQLEPEAMINWITDVIKDAVKFSKEISFTIYTKPKMNN